VAFPFVCFEVWKFIAPALYENEKKTVRGVFLVATLLFYIGLVVGYLLIVPISLNFFLGYKVSESIVNTISLTSYISLFTSTVLAFGIVFEFPAVITILSQLGLVTRGTLRKYRRHAIVAILIIAAIITPADPFSMIVAAAPLFILFEVSVLACKKDKPETADDGEEEDVKGFPSKT
jgi:sec-independent protein translocase protein TatC